MPAVSGFVSRCADIPVVSPGLYREYPLVFLKKLLRKPVTKYSGAEISGLSS
jgi:hypothetical protein